MRTRFLLCILFACLLAVPLVALSAEAQNEPITLTCLVNHTWFPSDTFTGIIPEEITRATGVKLEIIVAKNEQHLNMLLSSNDLPDLVYTSTQFDMLSDAQYCYDYDSLMRQYDIQWDIADDLRFNGTLSSQDGKLYTVINHYTKTSDWADSSSVPMTASLMVRQDILDALGNPSTATREELFDVFLQVRAAYPNMVPLTFDMSHRFNVFRAFFGIGLSYFTEQEDGSYLLYAKDARYYDMLRYLNQLYQNECLLIDNFSSSLKQSSNLYRQGISFAHSGCTQNYNLSLDLALRELHPDYRSVELYPPQGAVFSDSNLGWSGTFITKNNRHPETSMRFVAWMFTQEGQRLTQWGREGIDYALNEQDMPIFTDEVLDAIHDDTYNARFNPWFYFGTSAITEATGRCALLNCEDYEPTYSAIRALYVNMPWIAAAMPIEGSAEKEIFTRFLSFADTQETQIIISQTDAEFEANYRNYMDLLDLIGVPLLERCISQHAPAMEARYQSNEER